MVPDRLTKYEFREYMRKCERFAGFVLGCPLLTTMSGRNRGILLRSDTYGSAFARQLETFGPSLLILPGLSTCKILD
jgi:hypothetical protein